MRGSAARSFAAVTPRHADVADEDDSRVVLIKFRPAEHHRALERHERTVRGLEPERLPIDEVLARDRGARLRALFDEEGGSPGAEASSRWMPAYIRGERAAPPQDVLEQDARDRWRFARLDLPAGVSRAKVIREVASDPRVEYVDTPPVRTLPMVRRSVRLRSDPLLRQQWYLRSVGFDRLWRRVGGREWPDIMMLDSAVHLHPDIESVMDADELTTDPREQHGTMVCGLLAAQAENDEGIVGASRSHVRARRIFRGGSLDYSKYYAMLERAIGSGVRVINLSIEGTTGHAMEQNLIDDCVSNRIVVVASAGNHGSSARNHPAVIPGVIGVGALDEEDRLWPSSGRGANVYVTAPGAAVVTTVPPRRYDTVSGTSFAAPLVSAAAAGLIAAGLAHSARDVAEAIRDLAVRKDGMRSPNYGWGLLDLRRL